MAVLNIPSATQYPSSGTSTSRKERSFAELYRQARQVSINDNDNANTEANAQDQEESSRNQEYIANLHDRVDTLRGEILARVFTARDAERENPEKLTGDISRLSTRLETLRSKLRTEEERLSGHLVDVTV